MKRASVLLFLFTLSVLVLSSGCRALVSESNQQKIKSAPSKTTIGGIAVTLRAELQYSETNSIPGVLGETKRTGLRGRIRIESEDIVPAWMEITHFSLRPGIRSYYDQNYYKDRNGIWVHASRGHIPTVEVVRQEKSLELKFEIPRAILTDKKAATWDLGVNVTDLHGERVLLAQPEVPVSP